MSKHIQAVRGMRDVLPDETPQWRSLENTVQTLLAAYGYQEIRMPILEQTGLFARAIGEVTDIVEKEMYTFEDRNGDSLTLRPEGTAGCVRAVIQANLLRGQTPRLYYFGPMFRHERPQKGRYRQFHQFGVETFGLPGPDVDAEQILMSARLLRDLGLDELTLELNTLGTAEARAHYRDILSQWLAPKAEALCEDCQQRIHRSPMRVLDCKVESCQALVADAPLLRDHLDPESESHFAGLLARLDHLGVAYTQNPTLVRGLDYYNRTVFEWKTQKLGAQGTVLAGGRYDALVEQIGGPQTPAVGFAAGIERLLSLMAEAAPTRPDLFIAPLGESIAGAALTLAETLRDQDFQVIGGPAAGMKQAFKGAERSHARQLLLLGEEEAEKGQYTLKDQDTGQTVTATADTLAEVLRQALHG